MIKLFALMYKDNEEWKLAHRIKRNHSVYSSPITNRPLVFATFKKAAKALETTATGNYLPAGTTIIELTGEPE